MARFDLFIRMVHEAFFDLAQRLKMSSFSKNFCYLILSGWINEWTAISLGL
jgi:hypothetical protein